MSAPTSYSGYVDEAAWYQQTLVDASEQIGDLHWPTSVTTFSRMRRDPQLAAVLKALTLPIRQAHCQVNPLGARPEAVQLVADGFGLPIADAKDAPTGARTRGVRWADHNRLALLSLVWGHMPFEERYEVTDRTRLVGLADRMPSTIRYIQVTPDGDLDGIGQWATPGTADPHPIPAAHLLWYAQDREGSAWHGNSILRPAYAPWLLKREMLRAHAIGNRRFNHGVPTVRWDPGSDPTPAQIQDAAAFASAARAGDQAGGSLPPGAHLELVGLSGGVPDTLGFIQYLDQQMSRMVLAGMLDLGQTKNGSRALGAEFVDLFLLTLQALADDLASSVTSQTAARIVAYNFGDDEPVPQIQITDVGSKREVTVEALQGLLASGALQADPELESWVRRGWGFPARSIPWTPPAKPGAAGTNPLGPGVSQLDAAAATPELEAAPSVLGRPPSELEAAAHVDFEAIQGDWQTALDALLEQWPEVTAGQRTQVLGAVKASADAGSLVDLPSQPVDSGPAADLLEAALVAVAEKAADRMRAEAAAQGARIAAAAPAAVATAVLVRLGKVAAATAAVMAGGLVYAAAREALRVWSEGRTGEQVAASVGEHLDGLSDRYLQDQLGGALTAAQNEGRLAVIEAAAQAPAVYASETLDKATCEPCRQIDGHQYPGLAEARAAYANGGFNGCKGGLRCRGIVIAKW